MAFPFFSKSYITNHETPLLRFGSDPWRLRDALEHTLIVGAPGSAKSSGSGRALAHALLRSGAGMLVLCVKGEPDSEADRWEQYCRETGRSRSFIRFDGSGLHQFNFLRYALAKSLATDPIRNTVALLEHVLSVAKRSPTREQDDFWSSASNELITQSITALFSAWADVTLEDLMKLITSRPSGPGKVTDPAYQQGFMHRTLVKAGTNPAIPLSRADIDRAIHYLTEILPNPDPRTTGNLVQTVSAKLSPLLSGPMRELFNTGLNIVPEMTFEGAVIVLDFPVRQWHEAGHIAQHIFKYLWQRAVEERGSYGRPVYLWIDEYPVMASEFDADWLGTVRSSRCGAVFIAQNVPGIYAALGGRSGHDAADKLLANLGTKVLHANSCQRTNQWAADIVGKTLQWRHSRTQNDGTSEGDSISKNPGVAMFGPHTASENRSEGSGASAQQSMEYEVEPARFTRLRNGGAANRGRVDAIIHKASRTWRATQAQWCPVEFIQPARR
jgi:hypothetical protein